MLVNLDYVLKRAQEGGYAVGLFNTTDTDITVELLYNTDERYWIPNVTLPTVAPGQTGKIQLALQTADCPIYGPLETKMYVQVNGKRIISDEYAITIKTCATNAGMVVKASRYGCVSSVKC